MGFFVFFVFNKFFILKNPIGGASSLTLVLGSLYHFLEQKRAVGLSPEEKMGKFSVLQNEWSAFLLGEQPLLMLGHGNPSNPAFCLLTLPRFKGD